MPGKDDKKTPPPPADPNSDATPGASELVPDPSELVPAGTYQNGVSDSRLLDGERPRLAVLAVTDVIGENARLEVRIEHSDDGTAYTTLDPFQPVTKDGVYEVLFQTSKP